MRRKHSRREAKRWKREQGGLDTLQMQMSLRQGLWWVRMGTCQPGLGWEGVRPCEQKHEAAPGILVRSCSPPAPWGDLSTKSKVTPQLGAAHVSRVHLVFCFCFSFASVVFLSTGEKEKH